MTLVQVDEGPDAGLYLTGWAKMYKDEWRKPFSYFWVNCLVHDVRALLALSEQIVSP